MTLNELSDKIEDLRRAGMGDRIVTIPLKTDDRTALVKIHLIGGADVIEQTSGPGHYRAPVNSEDCPDQPRIGVVVLGG